jgi:hypothetical protein
MAKSKKRRKEKSPANPKQRTTPRTQDQEEQPGRFGWVPLWGWILIFLAPLVISEFMFYRAGRRVSMILFPLAWIGFWVAMMQRAGWPIFRKRKMD